MKAVYDQKEPYTDEEVTASLDGALQTGRRNPRIREQPKTFRLLIELMLETGLRVGDAVFDPRCAQRGDCLGSTPIATETEANGKTEAAGSVHHG